MAEPRETAGTKRAAALALVVAALAAPASAELLEWKPRGFEIKAKGYVQGDLRAFPNWDVAAGLRAPEADIRRWRVGFELKAGRLSGECVVEAADLANTALGRDDEGPAFSPREHFKDVYLELALGKDHFLRAGHFKLPVSRELLLSASRIDFVERSLLANALAPERDWGLMVGGTIDVARGLSYQLGLFAGDGWSESSRAETTGAGRVVVEPRRGLQLAVNGSLGTVRANPETGGAAPQAKGLHGKSASDWTFFHRPYVDGQRRRLGGDVQYVAGPLTLKAELLASREERRGQGALFADLPAVESRGWSTTAVWRVRGPRSKKDKAHGRTVLDLAVRHEMLHFDDEGPGVDFEGSGTRTSNLRPASSRALSGGVSCWPASFLRLMGDVIVERYSDALLAPESGRRGSYVTVVGRLQIGIP